MPLTNEKAYVLGLLVGGGTIANSTFTVDMPFDKWGADPLNAASISHDLLIKVRGIFRTGYGFDIDYTIGNGGRWSILPMGSPSLKPIIDDLTSLGLPTSGTLLNTATLNTAKTILTGLEVEHFLTGIFDARASLTDSHRRFNDDAPVVSIEIPGSTMNFDFVVQLCCWLTDLGSVTDQILFNHPCQHAAADPSYLGWKKGFKIRFLAKSFLSSHSFALKAKATSATALATRQNHKEQTPCQSREGSANTVSIHNDIKCRALPLKVRGKLFLHYHHICAAMGCPHAPGRNVRNMVRLAPSKVCVHPRLSKGEYTELRDAHRTLAIADFPGCTISNLRSICSNIRTSYIDYPEIEVALAFLVADTLNGKRHIGPKDVILAAKAGTPLEICIISGPDKAPIFIGCPTKNRGVLLSCPTGGANAAALRSKVTISGIDINVT